MGAFRTSLIRRTVIIVGILMTLSIAKGYAQLTCEVTLRNDTLIDANNLLVDIYVRSTSGTFYYSSGQYKITFNKASILNGGSITGSIVPGYSELTNAAQIPTSVNTAGSTYWRVLAELPPSSQAACSQISSTGYGTRICRVQLTNTQPFGAYRPDNLLVTTTPYATGIFYALADGSAVAATMTLTNTNLINPVLNGGLTAFNVTGGVAEPATITVSGSQSDGVIYILNRDGSPVATAVGDGNPISFTNQPAGTYTVSAHRIGTYIYSNMNGTVIVSAACVSVSITSHPSGSTICAGGTGAMTVGVTGTSPYTYQWQYFNGSTWNSVVNGTPTGASYTGATTNSLSVSGITTAGSYQYHCYITNCSGSNNATSNTATLTVNAIPTITGTTSASRCGTGTVTLSATASAGTINWYAASTGGTSLGTGSSYTTPSLSTTTTYYVDATNNGCTTATRTAVTATINSIPTISGTTPASRCGTGTVTLGATASAGTINWYAASTGGTSLGTGTSYTTPSLSATTTYYVDATSGSCTTLTRTAVVATVNTVPAAPVHTIDCSLGFGHGVITVTSPTGAGYEYRLDAGTYQTSTSFTDVANGSHTITVRNSSGCTTTGSGFDVSCGCVNGPTVALSSISGSTCGTTAVTVTNNTFGGSATNVTITENGTGTVSPGTATVSPFSFTYTPVAGDAGTIVTITVTTNNPLGAPCAAAIATYSLTVNAVPTITGTTSASRCGPGTVTLGATASAGTINWYAASTGGTSLGAGTSYTTPSLSATTTYYVDATNNGCTTASRTAVTATINAIPTITGTTPASRCGTGIVTLSATASAGTINWYSAATGGTSLGTGGSYTTPSIGTTTTYYVDATNNGCTTESRTAVIATVNSLPVVGNQTASIATGGTFTVTPSGVPAGTTYTWPVPTYTGGVTGGVAQTTGVTEISGTLSIPSGSGTAVYTVTPTAGSCVGNTFTVTVTVTSTCSAVAISSHPAAANMCIGGSTSMTVTAGGTSPFVYQWQYYNGSSWAAVADGTPAGAVYANTSTATLGISGITSTGTWQYRCYITNCGGSTATSNAATLTVNALPSAPAVGSITQPSCTSSTGSVVLSGLPSGSWTINPGTRTGSTSSTTITGLVPGTYNFTVTNSYGCTSLASSAVVINTQPAVPAKPVIGTVTQPTCAVSTGSVGLSGLPSTGTWTIRRYPGGSATEGSGVSVVITSLNPGTYNFSVENEAGCVSPLSDNVVINAQPVTPAPPTIGTITHPTYTVPTGSVSLNGLPSGTWTILGTPGDINVQGTGSSRTISGLEPGTYTFTVTNSVGCTSLPSANVVINPRPGTPTLVITNPATICSNQTADLTLPAVTAGSEEGLTFTYWTDALATVPYSTPSSATAGTYYIKGTNVQSFYAIKPVVVYADQLPVADAGPDQVLDYTFGTTLNAEVPEYGSGLWALVSGAGTLFNSTDPATTVTGLALGDNVFSWTVTNGVCSPVSDFVTVKVNDLVIPTLITPNQDGRNDFFVLRGLESMGKTELVIFDRRGLRVYENNDYDNLWEGLDYNSNPLPDDTYFYVIRSENGLALSGYIVVRR